MTVPMEADDLDNLISDSLGGVQSVLDAERRSVPPEQPARSTGEAVRELQQGPKPGPDSDGDGQSGEALFNSLVKSFQDENFQKVMAEALRGADGTSDAKGVTEGEPASGSSASAQAAGSSEAGMEEFLHNFMKSFDGNASGDGQFGQDLTSLMTTMLSNDIVCDPMQQIVEVMEPWLKTQKSMPAKERSRCEDLLRLYREVIAVYKGSPDPLPTEAREEVQRLLAVLQTVGPPPEEVMQKITPKEAKEGADSFEDFMKSMGLDQGLGSAEQDLIKKLSEDPEELAKVMKDMSKDLPTEDCKTQ